MDTLEVSSEEEWQRYLASEIRDIVIEDQLEVFLPLHLGLYEIFWDISALRLFVLFLSLPALHIPGVYDLL